MIRARNPELAEQFLAELTRRGGTTAEYLHYATEAARQLDR